MIKRIILAASLAAFATPAFAGSVLYGSDNENLYRVSTSSGAVTFIGSNGLGGFDSDGYGSIIRDLTSSSSALYGAQWNASASGITGAIATFNAATGAITSSVAVTGLLETGFNQGVYAIAFDRMTNTLFGTTSRRLYTINATTGAASFVGNLTNFGQIGLGYDAGTNALFSVTQSIANNVTTTYLNMLDRTNAATLSSTILSIQCGCDIAFDPLGNQGYISNYLDTGSSVISGLDRLNAGMNGTITIGANGPQARAPMSGLAFFGQMAAVPEPASWAMMIAGFGMIGGAMRRANGRTVRRKLGTA